MPCKAVSWIKSFEICEFGAPSHGLRVSISGLRDFWIWRPPSWPKSFDFWIWHLSTVRNYEISGFGALPHGLRVSISRFGAPSHGLGVSKFVDLKPLSA